MSKFIKLGEAIVNTDHISHIQIIRYGNMSDTIEIKLANGTELGGTKSNLPKLLGCEGEDADALFDDLWEFLVDQTSPVAFVPKSKRLKIVKLE